MYVGKVLGKEIKLSNQDYQSLKKKWHPEGVKASCEEWMVFGKCTLCEKYCKNCPIGTLYNPSYYGCYHLLRELFPRAQFRLGSTGTWFCNTKKTVKKYMQKIQDILNTFERQ